MKKILLLIGLIFFAQTFIAQVASGISKSGYVSIAKDPPKPPFLEISSLRFSDSDGNMKINASEQVFIFFDLINSGLGKGINLKLSVKEKNQIPFLDFDEVVDIGLLDIGESKQLKIPIKSGMDLPSGKAFFIIKIDEANGFDSNPKEMEIETMAFREPLVKVVDYTVSSDNSNTLQKRKPFFVNVLVQNIGKGPASSVGIKLLIPENVFCMSSNKNYMIDKLEVGDEYLLEYELYTNNEYNLPTISLDIKVSEKYGKYAENKNISLTINQKVLAGAIVVQGKQEQQRSFEFASLTSKIDKNIPYNPNKNPYRIALIIGNEDYSRTLNAEVNVEYARNDAEIFKQYALQTLGVTEKNIHFLQDATAGRMQHKIDLVASILEKYGDEGELIFYYAGHGFPDPNTKTPYIIPVDVNATNLSSAIKLVDIYKKFGNTGAARITIFLDACFTGGGRNQGLLAARSVAIKPKEEMISGNMVVFSATTDKQTALPYKKEKHGMFTYFLLDKIQQSGGDLTYGELSQYVIKEVGIASLIENGKPQDPEVNTSSAVSDSWREWKLK